MTGKKKRQPVPGVFPDVYGWPDSAVAAVFVALDQQGLFKFDPTAPSHRAAQAAAVETLRKLERRRA